MNSTLPISRGVFRSFSTLALMLFASVIVPLPAVGATASGPSEQVLIRTAKPYDRVVAEVTSRGGRVTHQYSEIDGIAAEVPRAAIAAIRAVVGPQNISKDDTIQLGGPSSVVRRGNTLSSGPARQARAAAARGITSAETPAFLQGFARNNLLANVTPLHAGGTAGQGVIVAVIDSGIRPGYPHLEGDGSVIGGEDFVGDGNGYSNSANDPHGTFVAGMISGNALFTFAPGNVFLESVRLYSPDSIVGVNSVPLIGSAPAASIYALRVFGPSGSSVTSRVLAAMNRVIELRKKYDAGQPGGLNIQVCNMSLILLDLVPAEGLGALAVNAMMDAGIVPVVAAANEGPSGFTAAGPATGTEALVAGAASLSHTDRIALGVNFGDPSLGAIFRPSTAHQTAVFSSRGPLRDGRSFPDVLANGMTAFGQGYDGPDSVSFIDGTSEAAPTVAGVAALLRQRVPWATARQIRNAIMMSANPNIVGDGSTVFDQGEGYVDALAAVQLLESGAVPDSTEKPRKPQKRVEKNVEKYASLEVQRGDLALSTGLLKPAQRFEILYEVEEGTTEVKIEIRNFAAALPPAQQNVAFGDDLLLAVYPAANYVPSAYLDPDGAYDIFTFRRNGTFVNPYGETGIMRITVSGSWTNAGQVSAQVVVTAKKAKPTPPTAARVIRPGQTISLPLHIPPGTGEAEFVLSWKNDWGQLYVSDLDLILIAPDSSLNFAGATLRSPERVTIPNPQPGTWTMLVDGFEMPSATDVYELRVKLDDRPLH